MVYRKASPTNNPPRKRPRKSTAAPITQVADPLPLFPDHPRPWHGWQAAPPTSVGTSTIAPLDRPINTTNDNNDMDAQPPQMPTEDLVVSMLRNLPFVEAGVEVLPGRPHGANSQGVQTFNRQVDDMPNQGIQVPRHIANSLFHSSGHIPISLSASTSRTKHKTGSVSQTLHSSAPATVHSTPPAHYQHYASIPDYHSNSHQENHLPQPQVAIPSTSANQQTIRAIPESDTLTEPDGKRARNKERAQEIEGKSRRKKKTSTEKTKVLNAVVFTVLPSSPECPTFRDWLATRNEGDRLALIDRNSNAYAIRVLEQCLDRLADPSRPQGLRHITAERLRELVLQMIKAVDSDDQRRKDLPEDISEDEILGDAPQDKTTRAFNQLLRSVVQDFRQTFRLLDKFIQDHSPVPYVPSENLDLESRVDGLEKVFAQDYDHDTLRKKLDDVFGQMDSDSMGNGSKVDAFQPLTRPLEENLMVEDVV